MTKTILVTGIPGSGKTTVSQLLAAHFPRSAVISGDVLRKMIVSGYRDPNEPWDDEMRSQYNLSFKGEADLARNLLDNNFVVVVDDVVRKGELYDEWLKHFEGVDHRVVLLMPSVDAALKRNADRSTHTVPERTLHGLQELYKSADNSDWIVIDTSSQTENETVDAILAKL